ATEHLLHPLDARPGPVGVGADELRDRVQAVEEEVRVDLGAQGGELRGRGQLDELALAVPEPEHALPVLMVADERQENGRDDGGEGVETYHHLPLLGTGRDLLLAAARYPEERWRAAQRGDQLGGERGEHGEVEEREQLLERG